MNETRTRIGMVLCGGRSSRMKVEKASLQLSGKTFLQRVIDALQPECEGILLVKRCSDQFLPKYLSTVEVHEIWDENIGQGPVESLRVGIKHVKQNIDPRAIVFVSGCDSPLLTPRLVNGIFDQSLDNEITLPIVHGKSYPLCAAYSADCSAGIEAFYNQGNRRLRELVQSMQFQPLGEAELKVFDPHLHCLLNINTPEEFEALKADFD